jgi:hypothetical protein
LQLEQVIVEGFDEFWTDKAIDSVFGTLLVSELIKFCSLSRKVRSWVEVNGAESVDADISRVMIDRT